MLKWFPTPYPDELWYSVLCRYYMYAGYSSKMDAMKALCAHGPTLLSAHFALHLDEFCAAAPGEWLTPGQIIEHHTLYPYYSRFLPLERRVRTINAMLGKDNIQPAVAVGSRKRQGKIHYWRYCPICAQFDIERYGETYWHRLHQIPDLRICPIHKIYLEETVDAVQSNMEIALPIFPIAIPSKRPIAQEEIEVAQLMESLLSAPCDMESHSVPYLLDGPLVKNGFRLITGKQTNIVSLYHALQEKLYCPSNLGYGEIPNNCTQNAIAEALKKNRTSNISLVTHIAWLLGIGVQELLSPTTEVTMAEKWEQELRALFQKGWTKGALAQRYALDEDVVEDALVRLGLHVPKPTIRPSVEKQKELRLADSKKQILKAVSEKNMTQQKIKNRNSPYYRCYAWLMKNDRVWITKIMQELPDIKTPSCKRIDWKQMDEEMYPKVISFMNEHPQKPLFLTSICNGIGIRREWLKKLPYCKTYIEKNNH